MLTSQKLREVPTRVVLVVPIVARGTVMSVVGAQEHCVFQQGSPMAILVMGEGVKELEMVT